MSNFYSTGGGDDDDDEGDNGENMMVVVSGDNDADGEGDDNYDGDSCDNGDDDCSDDGGDDGGDDGENYDGEGHVTLKAMLHGAIFFATCNAILLLRDVKLPNTSLHYTPLMFSEHIENSSLISLINISQV
jgi:hypothetical protein